MSFSHIHYLSSWNYNLHLSSWNFHGLLVKVFFYSKIFTGQGTEVQNHSRSEGFETNQLRLKSFENIFIEINFCESTVKSEISLKTFKSGMVLGNHPRVVMASRFYGNLSCFYQINSLSSKMYISKLIWDSSVPLGFFTEGLGLFWINSDFIYMGFHFIVLDVWSGDVYPKPFQIWRFWN